MDPIMFCNRCRGLKVGWNRRYILHSLGGREWMSKSTNLLVLTGLLSSFVFAFPVTMSVVAESPVLVPTAQASTETPTQTPKEAPKTEAPKATGAPPPKPLDTQILRMLKGHGVSQDR